MSTSGRLTRAAKISATRRISPMSRQEDQDRAAFARERFERDARDLVLDARARVRVRHSASATGKARPSLSISGASPSSARTRAPSSVADMTSSRKSSRKRLLRIEREREAEVGVERALVELVEQHRRDALERGIVEDHAREHALGDDLDAGALRDEALQPHAQADRLADLLAQGRRHAGGGGAGGETARLEQDEALALRPRLVEQRERRARRLARAGRRDEHGARMRGERRRRARQRVVDRQGTVGGRVHRGIASQVGAHRDFGGQDLTLSTRSGSSKRPHFERLIGAEWRRILLEAAELPLSFCALLTTLGRQAC